MDRPPSHQAEEVTKNHCLPLAATCGPSGLNPFSPLAFWVSRSLQRARFRDGFVLRKPVSKEDLAKTIISWRCPVFGETGELGMEGLMVKGGVADDGSDVHAGEGESFSDSAEEESHGSSMSSESSSSEEPQSRGSSEQSPKTSEPLGFPIQRSSVSDLAREDESSTHQDDGGTDKPKPNVSDIDMMKERFSKLLLGEDMSGCGKGVCTALAISNAITNLCATVFGQLWRLEPLSPEKKRMWRREMEWLLCVSDHIVELIPSWQTFPDGSKVEVMTCRPRSDLYINLPALRKLDNMLFEILDGFSDPEFWYVEQGISAPNSNGSASFRRPLQHQEEKWWLPTPRVPPGGLHEKMRKQLQHKRECTNQILKAALAINSNALAEMEVPLSYLDSLPKNGRASLGDIIYRYISSVQFSPECLLDCIDLSSEYQALEIANRVETSIYVWRRSALAKPINTTNRAHHRSSWGMVKDLVLDAEKRELLADRAESLLLCLKQRFPGLTQTTLDMSKIQFNKDVGKSILESYSRVLESIAFNIIARIDDLIYVDDLTKQSDQFSLVPTTGVVPHKRVLIPYSVPVSSTPYTTAYATPHFSPAPLVSPARGERSPFISRKHSGHGFAVKKVLTDYLGVEVRGKNSSKPVPSMNQEGLVP